MKREILPPHRRQLLPFTFLFPFPFALILDTQKQSSENRSKIWTYNQLLWA